MITTATVSTRETIGAKYRSVTGVSEAEMVLDMHQTQHRFGPQERPRPHMRSSAMVILTPMSSAAMLLS